MVKKISFYFYILLAVALTVKNSYLTYSQYTTWNIHPLSRYLLPPHQSINYFTKYSFYRFWSHFLAALIFSLIILFLTKYFNKKRNYQHFEDEEPWFIAIAILVVGYPGWLVYFSLILIIPLLWSAMRFFAKFTLSGIERLRMTKRRHPEDTTEGSPKLERVSYYYLWLALAVIAILISKWLSAFAFWQKLII